MIKMIWAMDQNNLIGNNNKMPWHIKEDLLYFKKMTKDSAVVMGYNTYKSLLNYYVNKEFPYKKVYVLTHRKINDSRIFLINDIDSFLNNLNEDIFIIGGKNVYNQFMKYADELYVSYIKGSFSGDTYMDEVDLNKFYLYSKNETDKVSYTIYKKKVIL